MSAFGSELIARVHLIRVPWHLDRAACDELTSSGKKWKDLSVLLHVLDLSETQSVTPAFYRALTQFKSSLQSHHSALISINASQDILKQLERDGMVDLFSPQISMKDAIQELGLYSKDAAVPQLSQNLLKPLEDGFIRCFQTMSSNQINLKAGAFFPPFCIKDPDTLEITSGAFSEITLQSSAGQVAIYFTQNALKEFYEAVTLHPFESESSSGSMDLVREVLNISLGHARAEWGKTLELNIARALPATLIGDTLQEHLHGFVSAAAIREFHAGGSMAYLGVKLTPE